MSRHHGSARFRIRAVVGTEEYHQAVEFNTEIVQFMASFQLNTIPMGSLTIAVGRDMKTENVSKIHELADRLRMMTSVTVYLKVEDMETDLLPGRLMGIEPMLNQEYVVFEGYLVGIAASRGESYFGVTLHMLHWLADLNFASAVVQGGHPGSPFDAAMRSNFLVRNLTQCNVDAGGSAPLPGAKVGWLPLIRSADVTSQQIMAPGGDLWGNVLLPTLRCAVEDPFIDTRLNKVIANQGQEKPLYLKRARKALDQLKPNAQEGGKLNLRPLTDGAVPLANANVDAEQIAHGIRMYMLRQSGDVFLNTTLWGKLVGEWSPMFWYAVCPRITDALVVPFTGGLRGQPWQFIHRSDYNQIRMDTQLQQVLRAVGILHSTMNLAGADGSAYGVASDQSGLCGWFQPENADQGLVLLKMAPAWLADAVPIGQFSPFAVGSTNAKGTTADGAAGPPAKVAVGPAPDPKAIQQLRKTTMNRFAHQWYMAEALKGRAGELSGKLRFDIAPGSTVMIQGAGGKNIDYDQLAVDMFATVTRVTVMISSEPPQAGTAFSLAHLRTESENERDATSTTGSPLYSDRWSGATLISGPDFKPIHP